MAVIDNYSLGLYLTDVARAYDALPADDSMPMHYSANTCPGRPCARGCDHISSMPDTLRCYAALCRELSAQFDILRAFVDVQFTNSDPYTNSASMFVDVDKYRTLRVFTGGEPIPTSHMFSVYVRKYEGRTYNHIFRAVHDGLAHFPERNSFGPKGEFRAFLAHARLLSPDAIQALATETLGQNAYYIVHGKYAPQKFALLPPALIARAFTLADEVNL